MKRFSASCWLRCGLATALLAAAAGVLLSAGTARALEPVLDTLSLKGDPTPQDLDAAVASLVKRQRMTIPYLRAAILHTAVIHNDLVRPRRVVEKIAKPENDMVARLSEQLSVKALENLQASLTTADNENSLWEKAPKFNGAVSPAADAAARRQAILFLIPALVDPALREVSVLLEKPQLWTDQQMAGIDLEGYAAMLRDRYLLDKNPKALNESEWPFLQRRILERLLAPHLRPLVEQPWDQVRYSEPVRKVAMRALAAIDNEETREILATYRPSDKAPAPPEFVGILLKSGGAEAVENTLRLVLANDASGAPEAMKYLLAQLAAGDGPTTTSVQSVLRGWVNDQARLQQGIPGWAQALRLAQNVQDPQFIREMLAASLGQVAPTVLRPAASLVRAEPSYLADMTVRENFIARGAAQLNRQESLGLLNDIGGQKLVDALPVVASYLNASERDLQNMACDTLTKLTGQQFGRNPEAWRQYLKR